MIFKPYRLLILAVALFCISCQSRYSLVKSNRAECHLDSTIIADTDVINTYLPYKQKLDAQMNQVIGTCAKPLTKGNNTETLLGNFFADAISTQVEKIAPEVDFSIPTTKGGLRLDLPEGPITLRTIYEMMPFENELVLLKLKGADVEELLNFIAASGGQPVNGITLKIKDSKAVDVMIKGKPFDSNNTYHVLVSDYLANGGDNIKGLANPLQRNNVGLLVRNALISHVKQLTAAGQLINANLDGRITKI